MKHANSFYSCFKRQCFKPLEIQRFKSNPPHAVTFCSPLVNEVLFTSPKRMNIQGWDVCTVLYSRRGHKDSREQVACKRFFRMAVRFFRLAFNFIFVFLKPKSNQTIFMLKYLFFLSF